MTGDPNDPDRLHATGWGAAPKVWKHWIFAICAIGLMLAAWLIFGD